LGAALMQKVEASRLLLLYAGVGVLLSLGAAAGSGVAAVVALSATSFFMSIMFPTIFALGIARLGAAAAMGAPLIVMAIVGGAVFPPLMGLLSQVSGSLRLAMLVPALCFAVVLLSLWPSSGSRRNPKPDPASGRADQPAQPRTLEIFVAACARAAAVPSKSNCCDPSIRRR
jgi:FHS family L-fucose permease-like MFS transporter